MNAGNSDETEVTSVSAEENVTVSVINDIFRDYLDEIIADCGIKGDRDSVSRDKLQAQPKSILVCEDRPNYMFIPYRDNAGPSLCVSKPAAPEFRLSSTSRHQVPCKTQKTERRGTDRLLSYSTDVDAIVGRMKKVRFANDGKPTEVHRMFHWDFAYRDSRRKYWQRHAKARRRFRSRIIQTAQRIRWVLYPEHRRRIYEERVKPERSLAATAATASSACGSSATSNESGAAGNMEPSGLH